MNIKYDEYIQSPEWHAKVASAKRQVNYRCQLCYRHEDEVILDGHHRTYERLGHELPEDITVLCRDCHELFERHKLLAKYAPRVGGLSRGAAVLGPLAVDFLTNAQQAAVHGHLPGVVPTGFVVLDRLLLGGLHASTLDLVAARPGMGKSALAIDIALNAAKLHDKKVAFFSLQSPREQLAAQLLMHGSGVSALDLANGKVSEDEWLILLEVAESFQSLPIMINDTPGLTTGQLAAICHKSLIQDGLDLVVVDGIELMGSERQFRNPTYEVAETVRSLKILAGELNVPVLATCALPHGNAARSDHKPILSDLGNIGGLDQIADVVLFIYREDCYNEESERKHIADIIVAKQRGGPSDAIPLYFMPDGFGFRDLAFSHAPMYES